jgi:hypothetical protein
VTANSKNKIITVKQLKKYWSSTKPCFPIKCLPVTVIRESLQARIENLNKTI